MSAIEGIPSSKVIDNLLTPEECRHLISLAERNGYVDVSPMMVQEAQKECVRSIFTGEGGIEIATFLHTKLKRHLFNYNNHHPVGINSYVRILKMVDPREGLNDHQDNAHKAGSQQSFFSLVIYLTDTKGGTTFPKETVRDAVGRAVIFPHNVTHSSMGNYSPQPRYVLRSDIMFEKNPVSNEG
eukprot:TRINITY_DN2618_c6_g1_i1.p1 TRINITY_DN2618_c6_g1~~TRINITY_DN2618_c6_g1_i1.p1  ORF type:complete len:184 (+),score=22.62 TRINITY_DN2618_c6_g1_i1:60-611(+)